MTSFFFISTEELMLYTNWTTGSKAHSHCGYWKFYYQGIIKYVTKGFLRWATNTKFAIDKNINYIPDMGPGNKLEVTKNDTKYVISNISGLSMYPHGNSVYTEGSEFALFWRLTTNFISDYNNKHQVGDNWANFTLEHLLGNRTLTQHANEYHIQEVLNGDTSYMRYHITDFIVSTDTGNTLTENDGILLTLNVKNYETTNEN